LHTRLINLTQAKFSREQLNALNLGCNYAIQKDRKHYVNVLITVTENAIRHLDAKIQNTFRYLATRKINPLDLEVDIQIVAHHLCKM